MTEFLGLDIQLKKDLRKFNQQSKPKDVSIMAWGYYDWVTLHHGLEQIQDLFPLITCSPIENGENNPPSEDNFETHHIRTYYQADKEEEFKEKINGNKPCLVITEVKINNSEQKAIIYENIKTKISNKLYNSTNVLSFICDSLGHSDLVLLLWSDNYGSITELLMDVNELCGIDVLRSIQCLKLDKIMNWTTTPKESISVQFTLRPGTGLNSFRSYCENIFFPLGVPEPTIEVITGAYDYELNASPNEQNVLRDLSKKLFNPAEGERSDLILQTHTHWKLSIDDGIQPGGVGSISSNNVKTSQDSVVTTDQDFTDVTNILTNLVNNPLTSLGTDPIYPTTLIYGFIDILETFRQARINKYILPNIDDRLFRIMETISKNILDLQTNPVDSESLEKAVNLISDLMISSIQSNDVVLEKPNYNIRLVGNSLNIWLAYYNIIEEVCDSLCGPSSTIESNKKLLFFPTITFSDLFKSHCLFPDSSTDKLIVPIRIDKRSFIKPEQCLPLLFHELGHYIELFQIVEKYEFLWTACIEKLNWQLVFDFLGGDTTKFEKVFENLNFNEVAEDKRRILDSLTEDFGKKIKVFNNIEQFQNELIAYLDSKIHFSIQENIMVDGRSIELLSIIRRLISENRKLNEVNEVIDRHKETHKADFEILTKICKEYSDHTDGLDKLASKFSDLLQLIAFEKDESRLTPGRKGWGSSTTLSEDIDVLFFNFVSSLGLLEKNPDTKAYIEKRLITALNDWNPSAVIMRVFDIFKEVQSDIFMISILGLTKNRYEQIQKSAKERIPEYFYKHGEIENQRTWIESREKIVIEIMYKSEDIIEHHLFGGHALSEYGRKLKNELSKTIKLQGLQEEFQAISDGKPDIRFIDKYSWKRSE